MGKGKSLTEYEKGQIDALVAEKYSHREIAIRIHRSQNVVSSYLRNISGYGTKKSTGRPSKVDERLKRRIIRLALTGNFFAREIVCELQTPIKVRQVQRIIHESGLLIWVKRDFCTAFTKTHQTARLAWAEKYSLWVDEWSFVVFSDESKFNLDGPDGAQFYWHDKRKPKQTCQKRQSGGGSVMVWGAFSSLGKSKLVILEGNQSSANYIWTLSEYLLPFAQRYYGTDYVFQQDNASIHSSTETKNWFIEQNIKVLPWPSKSPDMNPIENLWAIIGLEVYAHGRQFSSVSDLKTEILRVWDQISISTLQTLVRSMPNRLRECIDKKGGKTHY